MNETIQQIYDRKSTRAFLEKEITKEEKQMILEAALQAPTAGNQTLYTILDICDPKRKEMLSESCDHQPFIATAKMILIFCADFKKWYDSFQIVAEDVRTPQTGDLMIALSDALIAAQNCVVAAESMGIGSCYIGDIIENYEFHKELLQLPDYVFPITMLVFGYPSKAQSKRKKPPRFALQDIVQQDYYHLKTEEELKQMFERKYKDTPDFQFTTWLKAFYERKYASDFSKEMSRSAQLYLQAFQNK